MGADGGHRPDGSLHCPTRPINTGLSTWQFADSLSLRLQPAIEWDGESNLVLEFALDEVEVATDGLQDGSVLAGHAEGQVVFG